MSLTPKVILALCFLHFGTSKVIVTHYSVKNYTSENRVLAESLTHKNTATYAECDKKWNCTLIQETFYNLTTQRKCNVDLKYDPDTMHDLLKLTAENNHSVVFAYNLASPEDKNLKTVFRIVDMNTCNYNEFSHEKFNLNLVGDCNVNDTNLLKLKVIPHFDGTKETFEAFVPNNQQCTGVVCEVTFDSNGEIISDPAVYLTPNLHVWYETMYPHIDKAISPKEFFCQDLGNLMKTETNTLKWVMNSTWGDHEIILFRYGEHGSESAKDADKQWKSLCVATDSSNDHFSLCWAQENSTESVDCMQYDSQAQRKINATVKLHHARQFKIFNSVKYGLLLFDKRVESSAQNFTVFIVSQIKTDEEPGRFWELIAPGCSDGNLNVLSIGELIVPDVSYALTLTVECRAEKFFANKQYLID